MFRVRLVSVLTISTSANWWKNQPVTWLDASKVLSSMTENHNMVSHFEVLSVILASQYNYGSFHSYYCCSRFESIFFLCCKIWNSTLQFTHDFNLVILFFDYKRKKLTVTVIYNRPLAADIHVTSSSFFPNKGTPIKSQILTNFITNSIISGNNIKSEAYKASHVLRYGTLRVHSAIRQWKRSPSCLPFRLGIES